MRREGVFTSDSVVGALHLAGGDALGPFGVLVLAGPGAGQRSAHGEVVLVLVALHLVVLPGQGAQVKHVAAPGVLDLTVLTCTCATQGKGLASTRTLLKDAYWEE